jgi:hypothetical protein
LQGQILIEVSHRWLQLLARDLPHWYGKGKISSHAPFACHLESDPTFFIYTEHSPTAEAEAFWHQPETILNGSSYRFVDQTCGLGLVNSRRLKLGSNFES